MPGILPVYAAGEADGELFLATRFVAGTDLRSLIEDGPLPPERAIGLVGQVADALDAAHERGLVHRDVKPGNVLVDTADHCYLCDFGLTTQLVDGGTTATGRLAGRSTTSRRSRSAAATSTVAPTSTRWPACSTSCSPGRRRSDARPRRRRSGRTCRRSRLRCSRYDELDPVFARALAKEPEERYEDCNAFADDARAALGLGPSPIAVRRRRRRIGGRLLALGGALLAVCGRRRRPRPDAPLGRHARGDAELRRRRRSGLARAHVGDVGRQYADRRGRLGRLGVGHQLERRRRNDLADRRADADARIDLLRQRDAAQHRRRVRLALGRNHRRPGPSRRAGHGPRRGELDAARTPARPRRSPSTSAPGGLPRRRPPSGPEAVARSRGSIRRPSGCDRARARPGDRWPTGSARSGCSAASSSGFPLRREAWSARSTWSAADSDVATGFGSVWVADDEDAGGPAHRRRSRRRSYARTTSAEAPFGVAVGADAVWAASDDGTVVRIDPDTDDVTVVPVGGAPRVVDVGAGRDLGVGRLVDRRSSREDHGGREDDGCGARRAAGRARRSVCGRRRWGRAGRVEAVRPAPVRGRGRAGRHRSSPTSHGAASAPRRPS